MTLNSNTFFHRLERQAPPAVPGALPASVINPSNSLVGIVPGIGAPIASAGTPVAATPLGAAPVSASLTGGAPAGAALGPISFPTAG